MKQTVITESMSCQKNSKLNFVQVRTSALMLDNPYFGNFIAFSMNKVDGDWSSWSSWSNNCTCCEQNPSKCGVKQRERSCNNPPPQHGGKPCNGSHLEEEFCETGK